MSEETGTIFYQGVADVLRQWDLPVNPWATQIAEQINRGTIQWQQRLPDGRLLHLLRVYSPIIQREEVFLGSVLFNDFLFKAIPSAAERIGIKQITYVANDLETAYFLVCGELESNRLHQAFLDIVSERLPRLYFGHAEPQKGIYGDIRNLFNFAKNDFEPFPVYAVPLFLALDLEKAVRDILKELLATNEYGQNLKTVRAALSFFYGRTSGGQGDAQSFDVFVHRLITEYGVLDRADIQKLFGLEDISKSEMKTAFDNNQFDPERYKDFLLQLITYFGESIDEGRSDWHMGFIHKDNKLISLSLEMFLGIILHGVQIGLHITESTINKIGEVVCCPICGQSLPHVRESYIIAGRAKGRFRTRDNKRGTSRQEPVICAKCALCVYLNQRLLGNYEGVWQKQPRKTARMPTKHNLVFHYGHHTDNEQEMFERQLDFLIEYARKMDKSVPQLKEGVEEIRHSTMGVDNPIKHEDLFGDWDEPAIEIVAQLEGGTQAKVLALGSGVYRLFIFILPQFRPSIKESEDFIQERFSGSRVAAFTLLALLRQLCGCNGPYYYRSLPQLSADVKTDFFYVQNRKESTVAVLQQYGAIVNFAKRVSYRDGYSPLTTWILLAERLLQDPFSVFSDVLRNSPIRAGDRQKNKKWKYVQLSNDWDTAKGLRTVDLSEYMTLYRQLYKLAEETNQ